MSISIEMGSRQIGRDFRFRFVRESMRVARAVAATAIEIARRIEEAGRADIAGAGNFGSRWTQGFHAYPQIGLAETHIRMVHDVPYWTVFETGKVIRGQPLLWIPLSFAKDAQGIRARDYPRPLFRVDRKSGAAPLLMTRTPGGGAEAKYFGKEKVTIPQKFHLRDIGRRIAGQMGAVYKQMFKKEGR